MHFWVDYIHYFLIYYSLVSYCKHNNEKFKYNDMMTGVDVKIMYNRMVEFFSRFPKNHYRYAKIPMLSFYLSASEWDSIMNFINNNKTNKTSAQISTLIVIIITTILVTIYLFTMYGAVITFGLYKLVQNFLCVRIIFM